jgi:hypothetical protein
MTRGCSTGLLEIFLTCPAKTTMNGEKSIDPREHPLSSEKDEIYALPIAGGRFNAQSYSTIVATFSV